VLAGAPPAKRITARVDERVDEYQNRGAKAWTRKTMAARLGSAFPAAGTAWWQQLMDETALSTQLGFIPAFANIDISDELSRIACPTLVISTEQSPLGNAEQTRAWQSQIPQAQLLILPGNSYHVAASDADECARRTFDFMMQADSTTACG
jgi:pimeloyl-ACP methyl ester carboxylesterase